MNVGKWAVWSNATSANKASVFKYKTLRVIESPEPSEIIYENSHIRYHRRILSWVLSFLVSSCLMVASFFIIRVGN
jgi:hypothetical protein